MSATLFYGYLAVASCRLLPHALAIISVAASASAIGLIGWDRVYDGAHWPSDVAGGYAIGALLLWSALKLPELASGNRRTPRREAEA